jgi:transcriptional regulator with XRE-family HTH domain
MTDVREELRDYLSTRRARLKPADVGLPDVDGRRVPGLRREEIALLAGVSVDYYVRLEQGRNRNVSLSVLDAVARALQLDDAERQHLIDLAQPVTGISKRRSVPRQRVRPAVRHMLTALTEQPAFVMGHRMDVLAANALADHLMGGALTGPGGDRNLARYIFLDESARELHSNWPAVAEETVAMLRLYAGQNPEDPGLSKLVGDLTLRSPEFARFWAAHDVRSRPFGSKTYRHPLVGDVTVAFEALEFPGDSGQRLCIYTAEPGSSSEQALRLLATLIGSPSGMRDIEGDVSTGATIRH